MKRNLRRLVGAGLGLNALLIPLSAAPVRADEGTRPYSAMAEAKAASAEYGIPGFAVVDQYIDLAGTATHAEASSDGQASSFASAPYPGSTAVSYPGLAALVTGSAPPGYPLYISASYPLEPKTEMSDPSGRYSLRALADEGQSAGEALLQMGEFRQAQDTVVQSASHIMRGDRGVTAMAVNTVSGLSVGPLQVASIHSRATTTYKQGTDQPVSTSELTVEGGKVGELTFAYDADGLSVANHGVPLPVGDGLAALNKALTPSGLSVQFRQAQPIDGGIDAAFFEIVSVAEVPDAGTGTLRLALGRATSTVLVGAPLPLK